MRSIALLLGLIVAVPAAGSAQQVWVYGPSNTPAPVAAPGTTAESGVSKKPAPTYHQIGSSSTTTADTDSNATQLVDLMGVGKRFDADHTRSMAAAKQKLLHDYPIMTPAFVNEWARRVDEQINVDDYTTVAAKVFAAHFNDDELAQLVQGQKNENAGKASGLPLALRQKLERELPTMAGEIAGAFAQMGAKLGADAAEQVAKEHPEWLRRSTAAGGSK
jgi:hypothetical protein